MAGSEVISISIDGAAEAAKRIGTVSSAVQDLHPVMGEIGKYLSRFFASEVFASRGSVIGEPWPALNARYAVQKAKRYPGRPPLVRTGVMQRNFVFISGATFARVTNKDPKFNFHQSDAPRSKMPERIMMKVDEARAREIARMVGRFLDQAARRA